MSTQSSIPTGQWATFFVGKEQFAVAVEDVQEVLLAQPLTPVPLAPPEIIGLLNLRGAVMPAFDLRRQLGLPEAPSDVPRKMLVLDLGSGPLTLMVDEIGDVFELAGEGWRPPPETLGPRRDALFGIFPLKDQIILGLKTSAVYAEPGDP
ncbi:MAG: chemotaxis protein CheW [Myxococcaceae bacterium]